jgi:hypothetical protein
MRLQLSKAPSGVVISLVWDTVSGGVFGGVWVPVKVRKTYRDEFEKLLLADIQYSARGEKLEETLEMYLIESRASLGSPEEKALCKYLLEHPDVWKALVEMYKAGEQVNWQCKPTEATEVFLIKDVRSDTEEGKCVCFRVLEGATGGIELFHCYGVGEKATSEALRKVMDFLRKNEHYIVVNSLGFNSDISLRNC